MTTDPAALAEKIQAINEARAAESAGPNYNVAPTTTITTVVRRHEEPDDEPNKSKRQDCERRSLGEVFEKNRLETLLTSNQVARRLTGMALLMSQMGCG